MQKQLSFSSQQVAEVLSRTAEEAAAPWLEDVNATTAISWNTYLSEDVPGIETAVV